MPLLLLGHPIPAVLSAMVGAYLVWLDKKAKTIFDAGTGEKYLKRWHLIRTKWFKVYLHRIYRADKDRDLHNHPWSWARAIILWGGYYEYRTTDLCTMTLRHDDGCDWCWDREYRPGSVNRLDKDTYHRIATVKPNTWTLFIAGRRYRRWGFLVNGKHLDADQYLHSKGEYSKQEEVEV